MSNAEQDASNDRERLGPPKFSLRTLLGFVTLCACLLGVWQWFGALAALTTMFVALSIFAHVAGNAIGTRLRDGREKRDVRPVERREVAHHEFAPITDLSRRDAIDRSAFAFTLMGAVIGGGAGCYAMRLTYGSKLDLTAMSLSALAFAVFGSLAAFLSLMLVRTAYQAISQSLRHK